MFSRRLLTLIVTCFGLVNSDPSSEECSNFTLPGCSCEYLGTIHGITCSKEADMSKLRDTLDSTFGENHTYEIALHTFPIVPPNVVQGLILFRLVVDSSVTTDVSQSALDGVISLKWFYVYISSLTRIPSFLEVSGTLTQINIDNSRIFELMDEIQDLPLLSRLSFRNNSIQSVHPQVFKGTTAVEYLDLSYNRIRSLPQKVFDGLGNIIKIDLGHNQLYTAHGLFQHICSTLRFLYLEFNNLTTAEDILCSEMPLLRHLSLNNNPLSKLTTETFNKTIPGLVFLYLNNCNFTEFSVEYFKEIPNLSLLELSFNEIKHIGNETVDFGSHLELIMDGNHIQSFAGRITNNTAVLYFRGNNLQRLENMLKNNTQLFFIDFSRNQLVALEKSDFSGASGDDRAIFKDNEIARIDAHCFDVFADTLHLLDLSGNRLTSLNTSVQSLYVLRTLDISNNLLDTLDYTEFIGMGNLTELIIRNNRIITLKDNGLNIPILQYLNLQNNSIKQLDMTPLRRTLQCLYIKGNVIESLTDVHFLEDLEMLYLADNHLTVFPYSIMDLPKLQEVTLSGNPWACSCDNGKVVEFRNWLISKFRQVLDINETLCAKSAKNKAIVSASYAELCPSNAGIYLIVVLSLIAFGVVVLAVGLLYARNKIVVKAWLYSKGLTSVVEKDISEDTPFAQS